LRLIVPVEFPEFFFGKGPRELPCPISTEIGKYHEITSRYPDRQIIVLRDGSGFYKLVRLSPRIGHRQSGKGVRRMIFGLSMSDEFKGCASALPIVVPVHGIVTAADARNPPFADFRKPFQQFAQVFAGAFRWRVTAVQKGMHVFMEKSFAVDAPGIRRVLRTGELAKEKNLKVASGLMSRHYLPLEQAIEQIQTLCRAIDSLRADIFPKNPKNFAIMAEGPVDEIRKLQADIDAYINRLESVDTTA